MLVIMTLLSVRSFCKAAWKGVLRQEVHGVNVVHLLTCLVGWANLVGYLYVTFLLADTRERYKDFLNDKREERSREFYDAAEYTEYIMGYLRVSSAYSHLLFMCRCFMSMRWQPRLAVVTQTLLACSSDLFHYLLVLVPTFVAFAISGRLIFGRDIVEFATIQGALATCFKIAVESEYDWYSISLKDSRTAAVWIVLYMILVVMLMLNMVLAIIMDVYQEVRTNSGNDMSVYEHLVYIYHKLYYANEWVPECQLLDQIEECHNTIQISDLRLIFPEMHHYQMEHLMLRCKNKVQRISRVGISKTYTAQMAAAIYLGFEDITENLQKMVDSGWMGMGIEAGSVSNREWVKEILTSVAAQQHWMDLTAKHISTLQMRLQGETIVDDQERRRLQRMKNARDRSVHLNV